jgi:hypothetical protein
MLADSHSLRQSVATTPTVIFVAPVVATSAVITLTLKNFKPRAAYTLYTRWRLSDNAHNSIRGNTPKYFRLSVLAYR